MDNLNSTDVDLDEVYFEPELMGCPCPECGSYRIYVLPRASSPDDYTKQAECRNCGSTWEE